MRSTNENEDSIIDPETREEISETDPGEVAHKDGKVSEISEVTKHEAIEVV